MENDSEDRDDLIAKILANEGSDEDKHAFQRWVLESDENRRYFEQLKKIFESAAATNVSVKFDTDAAWQKVKHRLASIEKPFTPLSAPGRKGERHSTNTILKIAAGLLVFIAVGYGTWFVLSPEVQTQIVTTGPTTLTDTLPDGSTAFLNHKTKLTYRFDPRKNVREAKLTGEGFFTIRHEIEKPFIIESDDVFIKDIGTAFNVSAWPDSNAVVVTVDEGEVQIYTRTDAGLMLHAGEKGVYDKLLKQFSKIGRADTNVLAYKTKVFSFNNTDMRSVIALISSVYNVNIRLSADALNNCRLTVNFDNESLDTIIEILSETMGLTVTKTGSEIVLTGTGCTN